METVTKSQRMRQLARKVIRGHPELLGHISDLNIRVGYLESDFQKRKHNGLVYGECRKVPPWVRAYTDNDFVITFYERNIAHLSDEQREILMLHELMHIGIPTAAGEMQIIPHDVEDFALIIRQYGLDWGDEHGSEP